MGRVHFKGSRKLDRVAVGGEAFSQLIIHNVEEE